MTQISSYNRRLGSFGGIDIKAVIAGRPIGTLQGISYQITREKGPLYTMGSADPRGFARGKRAIAGSLVFLQFDRDPVMFELANPTDPTRQTLFLSDIDDLRPEFNPNADIPILETTVTPVGVQSVNVPGAAAANSESPITNVGDDQTVAIPFYADQIPPFDIVLSAANEQGTLAILKILGVELLNSGFGISIDDIVAEHSYTFVARTVQPWTPQGVNGVHPGML
jgi:hypothetical protein